ncbi:MAG: hypothetical protein HWN67_09770 [Candidatus Helarchaeota archaeon]|nr:hypothetical protein [Candidatus Helarchaeota archaeon]
MLVNEFYCPKCDQKAFPIKVEHNPKKINFIVKLQCLKHKTKLNIQENEMKNYINDLVQSTLFCQYCGATYPDYKELKNSIRYGGAGTSAYLLLNKKCFKCGKKSDFEIDNILYTHFFDSYFDYLKSQATPDLLGKYQNAMMCPECNNYFVANSVMMKNGISYIEGECAGSPSHAMFLDFPLNHQYIWLNLLPEAINVCKECNSTDLYLNKVDFKCKVAFYTYLNRRNIVQICNDCQYENNTLIHHSFYEIYRRILKEKVLPPTGKESLLCPKCDSEALLEQLILKPDEIQAEIRCILEHKAKISLEQDEKPLWIDSILSGVKKCAKCWSPNQRVMVIKPKLEKYSDKIRKTSITLQCLDCKKKRSITINNVVFDEIMDYLFK